MPIIKTGSLADIEVAKLEITKDTLVVLDACNTLFETTQILGSPAWYRQEWKDISERIGSTNPDEIRVHLIPNYKDVTRATSVIPVQEGASTKLLEELGETEGRLIVCTAREASLSDATLEHINSVGAEGKLFPGEDFSKVIADPGRRTLRTMRHRGGLINCGSGHKDLCIDAYLEHHDFEPKKIVMIDDTRAFLCQIEDFCEEHGIEFVGIHFEHPGAKLLSEEEKAISEYQLTIFRTTNKIPTDEEVREAIRLEAARAAGSVAAASGEGAGAAAAGGCGGSAEAIDAKEEEKATASAKVAEAKKPALKHLG